MSRFESESPFARDATGVLCAGDVPLPDLAAAYGTPLYVYDARALRARAARLLRALSPLTDPAPLVCYAVKANGNLALLETLARVGLGCDIVSGGELDRALAAGVPPGRIVFSGVGKTPDELRRAVALGLHQINVESRQELRQLADLAAAAGRPVDVALRVNPDIAAGTHDKISTGRRGDKFGLDPSDLAAACAAVAGHPHLRLRGLAVHIGSQLTDLAPLAAAFGRLADLTRALRADGVPLDRLDLGGGLGIRYRPEDPEPPAPEAYAACVRDALGDLVRDTALTFEPGRWLVGPVGALLARVVTVKDGPGGRFVVLDAAMNDLLRPSLYGAWHTIVTVDGRRTEDSPADTPADTPADVVGPVCETGDVLGRGRPLPSGLAPGDLVAILDAGAYGAAMASTYNARPLVAEALVEGVRHALVRRRLESAEMMRLESRPDWFEAPSGA